MSYSSKSNRRKICFIYLHSSNRNVAVVFVKYILRHRYHVHVVYVDLSVKLVFFLCVLQNGSWKRMSFHIVCTSGVTLQHRQLPLPLGSGILH